MIFKEPIEIISCPGRCCNRNFCSIGICTARGDIAYVNGGVDLVGISRVINFQHEATVTIDVAADCTLGSDISEMSILLDLSIRRCIGSSGKQVRINLVIAIQHKVLQIILDSIRRFIIGNNLGRNRHIFVHGKCIGAFGGELDTIVKQTVIGVSFAPRCRNGDLCSVRICATCGDRSMLS